MKVKLYCEDVKTYGAWNDKDAHLFRKEIHSKGLDLAYMPDIGESISLFTSRGWVEAEIGARGISHAFDDAKIRKEYVGQTWYSIWFEKITIIEHYIEREGEK